MTDSNTPNWNATITIHFNEKEADRGIPGSFRRVIEKFTECRIGTTAETNQTTDKDPHGSPQKVLALEPGWFCSACRQPTVQHAMWVDCNTSEPFDEFGTWNHYGSTYCHNDECEAEDIKILDRDGLAELLQEEKEQEIRIDTEMLWPDSTWRTCNVHPNCWHNDENHEVLHEDELVKRIADTKEGEKIRLLHSEEE